MKTLESIISILADFTTEGKTGIELENYAKVLLQLNKVEPAFLGYQPAGFKSAYPNILCVSINGEVIHGIPDDRKFVEGDVIKIDCGIKEGDQYDDGATTVIIGKGSASSRRLVKATKEALEAGVAAAKEGNTTNDIAAAIEAVAKDYELQVIHGYGGHGCGTELHMEPHIPNEVTPFVPAVTLTKGMRLSIEPMFSSNRGETYIDDNGWTIIIRGGGFAAHFEKTVVI